MPRPGPGWATVSSRATPSYSGFVLTARDRGNRKRFISARRGADLPRFRLHDLRHFMASQMLAANVPIVTVSQRLSHARTSTTLNVYAHSVPGGDREAAETLAAIIAAGREPGERGRADETS
jgi:integrase